MFIADSWMGFFTVQVVKVNEYICKVCQRLFVLMNFSFWKCSAMPLPLCLRNCSISFRSTKTQSSAQAQNCHLTSVSQRRTLCWNPTSIQKNFGQTVIQVLASDKVYCTHNNRQYINKILGHECLDLNFHGVHPWNCWCLVPLVLVLCTPKGYVYPQLRTTALGYSWTWFRVIL